MKKTGKYEKTL